VKVAVLTEGSHSWSGSPSCY